MANACAHTYIIKNGDGNSVRRGNREKEVLGGGGRWRGETRKQKHHSLLSRHSMSKILITTLSTNIFILSNTVFKIFLNCGKIHSLPS